MDDLPVPLNYVIAISIGLILLRWAIYFFWPDGSKDFGRFEGRVLAVWNQDGRDMTLEEDFAYLDRRRKKWHAPKGSVVNGASIPQAFWTVIGGPFEGRYRNASVTHDVACVEQRERWEDVHLMFYEACRCGGVDERKAKLLYYAVYRFGPRWEPGKSMVTKSGTGKRAPFNNAGTPTDDDVRAAEAFFAKENPSLDDIPNLRIE